MKTAQLISFLAIVSCGTIEEPHLEYPDYDRSEWKHWKDLDGDCQDARQEALIAASEVAVTFKDDRKCKVEMGLWTDPYTGAVFTDPRNLDVDHIVALKDAFESGGFMWSTERKMEFANDPANLKPVSASANRSKGSRGPDEWLPPNPDHRCLYIEQWMGVKATYDLSMTSCERSMLEYMMRVCGAGEVPHLPQ